MKNSKLIWRICQLGVILLSIITFTPLVIPVNIHLPELFGLPYTLWMGMLVSLCFTCLILIGIRVHPRANKNDEEL